MTTPERLRGITGVLLAGGKSRRMGQDKRFLELEGTALLSRALAVLDVLFPEVLISVAGPLPSGVAEGHRVVTDLVPDCAALGGIYSGLHHASHPRIFVAACDMPFLAAATIRAMAMQETTADIVIARLAQGLQPAHALYGKRCLPIFERAVRAGRLKIQDVVESRDLMVHEMSEPELRAHDPQLLSFMNVNTPADLEFARKLLATRSGRRA